MCRDHAAPPRGGEGAEHGESDLSVQRVAWAAKVLHSRKAGSGKEWRAEDVGVEGPVVGLGEVVLVGVPQGERDVDRGVVLIELTDIHVRCERHVHVDDRIARRGQRDTERRIVPRSWNSRAFSSRISRMAGRTPT